MQAAGGIMTADDLRNYRPHVRRPVRGRYRGHEIISMPPSSSGGVVLIEMLNVLEGYKLNEQDDAARLHLMIEAMRRAYADRAAYLGDPAVVTAPLVRLMSKRYAAQLRANIDPSRATPSREIRADLSLPPEGDNTTHFSVIDRYGNAVANTYTLNFSYGVGLVAEGTGVLLNNELDDFAARPATPNAYGLIGGEANAPGPNKRPLSSMTPDHRHQERPAADRDGIAGRQPHHHLGAPGRGQRDRPQHGRRARRWRRRASIISGRRTA